MKEIIIDNSIDYNKTFLLLKESLLTSGVIVFPTDTLYGICCDPFDIEAINKIYQIKDRPKSMPLILLGSNLEQFKPFIKNYEPLKTLKVIKDFWPGPLTLVVSKSELVSTELSSLDTIGIRIPDNKFLLEFLNYYNKPLASTSANKTNSPPACTPQEVRDYFLNEPLIDIFINNGNVKYKNPSTIIDITKTPPLLIREGVILWNDLKNYFIQQA